MAGQWRPGWLASLGSIFRHALPLCFDAGKSVFVYGVVGCTARIDFLPPDGFQPEFAKIYLKGDAKRPLVDGVASKDDAPGLVTFEVKAGVWPVGKVVECELKYKQAVPFEILVHTCERNGFFFRHC